MLLLIFTATAYAQTNSDSSNRGAENEDDLVVDRPRIPDAPNSNSGSNSQDESKSNGGAADKVFKPTEEISEDLPVPFPVDI